MLVLFLVCEEANLVTVGVVCERKGGLGCCLSGLWVVDDEVCCYCASDGVFYYSR